MSVQIKFSLSDIYPKGLCPKCNIGVFGYPRYYFDEEISDKESIVWECTVCGYRLKTPTADAKVEQ